MTADTHEDVRRIRRRERFAALPIDGQAAKNLVEAGLAWLRTNQQAVNALNVFPVPDGDTGTNMVLTMQSAVDEIADLAERNIGRMMQAVAHGALMGARGNSGVILSQLWRGFARALDELPHLDGPAFVRGFIEARDTAYRGVVRPVEGTILTVAKDIATAAEAALEESDDPIWVLEKVVQAADKSVQHTPELLSVLKDAGVVDAGGKGLFLILEGMLRFINGLPLDIPTMAVPSLAAMDLDGVESIEPGQDYEVVLDFRPHGALQLDQFYRDLEEIGTSIQVGEGDGIYRVHIHVPTENRYLPIDYAMSLGTITKVAIENLIEQMEALNKSAESKKLNLVQVQPGEIAAVVVAPGPGIARVFASLGAAAIVEGGQTMNPSTQEILAAFDHLPTDRLVVLPNNKNIIMAANASAELTVKDVRVMPSRTVPQGLAAILCLEPAGDLDAVAEAMMSAMGDVISGEVTTAVRSTVIDGVEVREGESIAILDDGQQRRLVKSASSLEEAVLGLLGDVDLEERELVTLFYGEEISKPEVNRIADAIRMAHPDLEVEIQDGGQPHYQFIISIE